MSKGKCTSGIKALQASEYLEVKRSKVCKSKSEYKLVPYKRSDPKIEDLGELYVRSDPKIEDPKIEAHSYLDASHQDISHHEDLVSYHKSVSHQDPLTPQTSSPYELPSLKECQDFWIINKLTNSKAELFFHHYEAAGWKTQAGEPVTDWQRLAFCWDKREKAYEHAKIYIGLPASEHKPLDPWQPYDPSNDYDAEVEDPQMWALAMRIKEKQRRK